MSRSNEKPTIGHNRPLDTDSIKAQLEKDYAAVEDATVELLAACRKLPTTVKDDEDLEKVAIVIRQLRDHNASIEAYRKAEKDPHWRAGQAVDGVFGGMASRVEKAMKILTMRVDDFQQEKLERARRARQEEERKARAEAERLEALARKARDAKRKEDLEIEAKLARQREAMAELKSKETPADLTRTRFGGGAMATMARSPTVEVIDYDKVPMEKLRPYIRRDEIDKAVRAWAKATSYGESMAGVSIEHGTKSVIR